MQMQTYTVKSGDSLSIIARDVLGDIDRWPEIARLNNLVQPYTIFPGYALLLPEVDVLAPIAVTAQRRPVAQISAPGVLDFEMTPQTWAYVGVVTLLLFLFTGRKSNG